MAGGDVQSLLLDLIGQIYEAAQNPETWPAFLQTLLAATEGVAAGFHVHDLFSKSGSVLVDVGGDPGYVRKYHEYYARINPWSRQYGHLIKPGQIVLGFAEKDLVGSEYYEDFWRPQGFYDSLSSYVERDQATTSALIVVRQKGAPEFEEQHVDLFRLMTPHLKRAIELQRTVYDGIGKNEVLSQALDRLPHAVVVVDERRKVLTANKAAQEVIARGDCLSLKDGELYSSDFGARQALRQTIDAAIGTTLRRGTGSGGVVELPRREERPISLMVSPVKSEPFTFGTSRPAALILISTYTTGVQLSDFVLADLYELTRTESRVAASLAAGESMEDIAEHLHISISTARTHLKRIFDKTGTGRQGELISMLLRNIAAFGNPPSQAQD
jgi:DNA-binding CsgD family transcriptional regulator